MAEQIEEEEVYKTDRWVFFVLMFMYILTSPYCVGCLVPAAASVSCWLLMIRMMDLF